MGRKNRNKHRQNLAAVHDNIPHTRYTPKAKQPKKRPTESADEKAARTELKRALEAKGLKIRKNSQLCKMYISGNRKRTAEQIADIMEEMEFLYSETTYQQILEEASGGGGGDDEEYECDYNPWSKEVELRFNPRRSRHTLSLDDIEGCKQDAYKAMGNGQRRPAYLSKISEHTYDCTKDPDRLRPPTPTCSSNTEGQGVAQDQDFDEEGQGCGGEDQVGPQEHIFPALHSHHLGPKDAV
mmetsp:Transcript_34827/g.56384  ORF Transcript_34827/g.56384 Transcript_34827/m.56384 type:complete len:240 (-) Transcript_34827:37-756(-)